MSTTARQIGREAHLADVVARVVAGEARRAGADGVLLAAPDGAPRELLERWLAPHLPVARPDTAAVAALADALGATGADAPTRAAAALRAWAESASAARGLLPVGATDKTTLLLGTAPLPARVLPLGDLSASSLAELGAAPPLPPVLHGAPEETVRRVDAALAAYLERGRHPDDAFGPLGALGEAVRAALDAGEPRRGGLLVPKLAAWTVGVDLER